MINPQTNLHYHQIYMSPKKMKELRVKIINNLYQYDFYHNELQVQNPNINEKIVLVEQLINNIVLIDNIIQKNLYDYTLDRMNKVDKAIIRLATFELMEKKLSHKIIINEAIELTKEYSSLNDNKQYKFNNKLLQLIYEDLESNTYKKELLK
ncbi:MAG: transcription antitermination protein NusB ['Conium maculatum' witches'-broom phytoplasma]|nr:transcription antitermination protein NusB ['Conium maculatum' witches'-broom phytoplasma]